MSESVTERMSVIVIQPEILFHLERTSHNKFQSEAWI